MNPYGLWVVLGIFELLGIFAVTNPSALVEMDDASDKATSVSRDKAHRKVHRMGLHFPPTADLGGFLFWP